MCPCFWRHIFKPYINLAIMEQNNERIVKLLYRRLKGLPLTDEENRVIDAWLARSESNRRTFENLSDEEWLKAAKKKYYAPGKEKGLSQLSAQLRAETEYARPFNWARLAVAAAVLFILASAIYLLVPSQPASSVAGNTLNNQLYIAPGGEAILTLSNGLKIPLRDHANGLLAQLRNGKQLLKQDGKLVYQSAMTQLSAGGVDTTTDPRSDQYSVMLPDGSRAWLNRGSTLNYPETFTNDKRVVELSGEAYFEIAQVAAANGQGKMPFVVRILPQSNGSAPSEVEVLGTHFNIYAHRDEPIKTTLTEGKIKMTHGSDSEILLPGQQAVIDSSEKIRLNNKVSVEEVLAWRKNEFHFTNQSIHTIMSELARWYGNPYVIEGKIESPFTLISDRNKPLSESLNQLAESGIVRITVKGGTVYVSP
jgi:ferric-dicitrate binding protein FerR (iron transport regulator)